MKFLLALVFAFCPFMVWAATVEVIFAENDFAQIIIQGEIQRGDGAKFYREARKYPRASVVLDSPGGDVREALSIGAEIAIRGYATYVGPGEVGCYSACALIWVSGARRYMTPDAVIGVHAAYKVIAGPKGKVQPQESGAANAQIGAFLNELGLTSNAIHFFTVAGPNEFNYLTPRIAQLLDIDVFIQDGFKVETPMERPTPRRIADNTTRILGASVSCAPILDLPFEPMKRQARVLLQEGHAMFGGEVFADLIVEYTDKRKFEIKELGRPAWCIENDAVLQRSGIRLAGLNGPSFDCRKATSPNEQLVCRSPEIWAQDRILSTAYAYFQSVLNKSEFAKLRNDQRAWLKRRERCRNSLPCTRQIYSARLSELGLK